MPGKVLLKNCCRDDEEWFFFFRCRASLYNGLKYFSYFLVGTAVGVDDISFLATVPVCRYIPERGGI